MTNTLVDGCRLNMRDSSGIFLAIEEVFPAVTVSRRDNGHLERDRASQNTVVLATTSDGFMQTLTEFQFAGESFAHGYPTVR